MEAAAEMTRLVATGRTREAAVREVTPAMTASKAREEAVAAAVALTAATEAATAAAAKADAVERAAVKLVQKVAARDAARAAVWAAATTTKAREAAAAAATRAATAAKAALLAEAEADALEWATANGGEGGSCGAAGPLESSEAAEVPDDYVCPITNETVADPISTVDEFTYEISGACGLLGFLSDTDDGDACPAARAPAASPAGSTLSPHAAAFRPSQHTDAITQARLMWQEAAAALGEDTDAAAGLLVIL